MVKWVVLRLWDPVVSVRKKVRSAIKGMKIGKSAVISEMMTESGGFGIRGR